MNSSYRRRSRGSAERGPHGYWLITSEHFHHRQLMTRGVLVSFGGSLNALGSRETFTINKMVNTQAERDLLWNVVKTGVQLFGEMVTAHP